MKPGYLILEELKGIKKLLEERIPEQKKSESMSVEEAERLQE